jgi:hypothetical protein
MNEISNIIIYIDISILLNDIILRMHTNIY